MPPPRSSPATATSTWPPARSAAALKLGLIDQVVVNQVPVVFGSGRPFFATGRLDEPLPLEDPATIVRGDRVTHLVYDVSR